MQQAKFKKKSRGIRILSSPPFKQRKQDNEAKDIVFPSQSMVPIDPHKSLFCGIICLIKGELRINAKHSQTFGTLQLYQPKQ